MKINIVIKVLLTLIAPFAFVQAWAAEPRQQVPLTCSLTIVRSHNGQAILQLTDKIAVGVNSGDQSYETEVFTSQEQRSQIANSLIVGPYFIAKISAVSDGGGAEVELSVARFNKLQPNHRKNIYSAIGGPHTPVTLISEWTSDRNIIFKCAPGI